MIIMEDTRKIPKSRFWLPFTFGMIVILSTVLFCVLNGGRWFEAVDPNTNVKDEFINDLHRVFGPFYMIGYFTVQSNLILAVAMIVWAYMPKSARASSFFLSSVSIITITFIAYWALLARNVPFYEWIHPYSLISNVTLHALNPILGFSLAIAFRKHIILVKRVAGVCSMYMSLYVAYCAILFGVGATIENNEVNGATIYSFLDFQNILYINLKSMPILAIFTDVVILVMAPFLMILINYLWAKVLRVKYIDDSYFGWMERIKTRNRLRKIR